MVVELVVEPAETPSRHLRAGSLIAVESGVRKMRLTKRAADVWDSAAFSGIFLGSGFFLLSE